MEHEMKKEEETEFGLEKGPDDTDPSEVADKLAEKYIDQLDEKKSKTALSEKEFGKKFLVAMKELGYSDVEDAHVLLEIDKACAAAPAPPPAAPPCAPGAPAPPAAPAVPEDVSEVWQLWRLEAEAAS
eukprot:4841662-Pyramimonas_sp.AAC.1